MNEPRGCEEERSTCKEPYWFLSLPEKLRDWSLIPPSSTVATNHAQVLNDQKVANVTKELNFYVFLKKDLSLFLFVCVCGEAGSVYNCLQMSEEDVRPHRSWSYGNCEFGTKPMFFSKAAIALNHGAISPACTLSILWLVLSFSFD